MIDKAIVKKTIQELQTTDHLYEFISDVDKVNEALFASKHLEIDRIISDNMHADTAELVKSSLQSTSSTDLNNFLLELTEALKATPKFSMTLAFKPDQSFINDLFEWIKANVGDTYFLEFTVDPEIIGGGVFVYNGLYKDHSLKKQLNKFFESKDAIKNIF